MKKIAFCFLINDVINHEELWYTFFKNIPQDKYNIYIHYKIDFPLKYFDIYKIDDGRRPRRCRRACCRGRARARRAG